MGSCHEVVPVLSGQTGENLGRRQLRAPGPAGEVSRRDGLPRSWAQATPRDGGKECG